MPIISEPHTGTIEKKKKMSTLCYHCGTPCITNSIAIDEKIFCCEGCKLVYEIINENGLCDYYKIQNHPALSQIKPLRSDKYAYLDNEEIAKQLYHFTDGDHTIVIFYIPGVHCSSCMWLLEHLHRLNKGIIKSRLNFTKKEVTIHFSKTRISIREVTELLATIGYEPYIGLDETKKASGGYIRKKIYKLGIAGFCFGNIMMMSFPEYLAHGHAIEQQYAHLFRYLNLLLSLPVFFYCASEFFITAWKGLKQKTLNIDAPIALAIIITFTRSVMEICTNTGSGYLDSMSGIVFFMLVGRVVQERTYRSISFHRDYRSYFPIAVNVVTAGGIHSKSLQDLKENDIVQLHNEEVIPADSIALKGDAFIDYSFVTGESEPVAVKQNEIVYAGGKQVGGQLTIRVVKPVVDSYLTSLWNHHAFSKNKAEENDSESAIHILSKYFTWILLSLAACTALYWSLHDTSMIIPSVTAMLIVACPCALLLSATFTNGNLLRIFSNNGLFLRDVTVIEQLSKIDTIVFDKTGTLTQSSSNHFYCSGHQFSEAEKDMLYAVVSQSKHPYSKSLAAWLGHRKAISCSAWEEVPGKGITAFVGGSKVLVGSAEFVWVPEENTKEGKAPVYILFNEMVTAFHIQPNFRNAISSIISLLGKRYKLSVLSGDNDKQRNVLNELFEKKSQLLFEQKPIDKLHYIEQLQNRGHRVIMIGDGLNDAGALQQSNAGIILADDVNNFTPSCDAILDARRFTFLPAILRLAKNSRYIIAFSFAISVMYNIAGLFFAMQGKLQPMVAAILMPCSTLSIVIVSIGVSSLIARRGGLSLTAGVE